jgi:hypothetical protein
MILREFLLFFKRHESGICPQKNNFISAGYRQDGLAAKK